MQRCKEAVYLPHTLDEYGDNMTTTEVSQYLRVSDDIVRSLITKGELAGAFRVGRFIRIPKKSVEDYMHKNVICVS